MQISDHRVNSSCGWGWKGFFQPSYPICSGEDLKPGKVSSAGVMKLLERGSCPLCAVKLLGQFCQDFTTNTALASAITDKKPACFWPPYLPPLLSLYLSVWCEKQQRFHFPLSLPSSAEFPKKILQTFSTLWQSKHCFAINHKLTCFAQWIWFAKLGFDSRLGDFVWLNQSLLKTTIISLQKPEACKPETDML